MAAKKTNYISYELEKLENYIRSLQDYLDDIDLKDLQDRLDERVSTNGNPIIKVIASKESQVTSYRNTLEKLPALYETLNRLRAIADTGIEEKVDKARGGVDLPGIFKSKMLTQGPEEIEIIKETKNSNDDVWEEEDD